MNKPHGANLGFSVVEVLVALTLLCIISAAVLTIIPGLTGVNRSSQDDIRVTTVAKSYMENTRFMASTIDPENASTWPDTPELEGYQCQQSMSDPDGQERFIHVVLDCQAQIQGGQDFNFVAEFSRQ